MRIGITYNLRGSSAKQPPEGGRTDGLARDDFDEEFDSPETIAALATALESLGHEVELLGAGEPLVCRLANHPRPELVFNLAEGCGSGRSRESQVPALLEMLGVPYTGSDPLCLGMALDKDCAKRLVRAGGVSTPDWLLFDGQTAEAQLRTLRFPVIIKPAYEGSSKGILANSVVDDLDGLRRQLDDWYAAYRQPILVEEFIDGDELTVGIVGNPPSVLGIMRVLPRQATEKFVYSLEVKRDWRQRVEYECPAALAPASQQAVRDAAVAVWQVLGCRDVARCDFRLAGGIPYFLEINPLPGLTPGASDLVILAERMGVGYEKLIERIVAAAIHRTGARGTVSTSAPVPAR